MTPEFIRALKRTLKIEGGYSDREEDRGGPTNLGVTLETLDRWFRRIHGRPATIADLKALTEAQAETLYCDEYWSARVLPCQEIAEWWEPLAWECFDSAVLHGPRQSALFLQRALNILNLDQKLFLDLKVDGWVGSVTLDALPYMDRLARGRERLMLAVNIEQGAFLRGLAMEDPSQEANYGGWILQRVQLAKEG